MKFLFFITLLSMIACNQESKKNAADFIALSERLQYQESNEGLKLKSGKFSYDFRANQLPFKRAVFLNASLLGYVSEIKAENAVAGVASPEYIYSEKIHNLIKQGKIQNVGNEQKYDVEKIISMKPDVIFTNYIASFENTYQLLKTNGIQVVFLDEYMEQKPLEKTAYIKIFGKLFGKVETAKKRYRDIEKNYNQLKKLALKATARPKVLANEMYGDVWYLPGGKTFTAHYISDANAEYILKNNTAENAVTMSFEEVYAQSGTVQYWINAGNHTSKKELLGINPFYAKLEVFNKGKIYAVTAKEKGKSNDFFESGVVRADLVLKDYIRIFHPEILQNDPLTYMKEIQ
ncbi:ABC transporter substrate-binding protein [Chryseobacterium sp. GMJ5]|uniref:ABC transporter substrate-binding protein n=1 Tax=Chryseobacterium gilvum TaxID=2976534 RepID=A0ABT2VVK8_9FLAO|nr:ABC transporter substrate-binding protein [Chryseobacterium gilvum]MCU7614026.1 ABC transporter substrate-binding protein [Chryseobacterium gilvum]